MDFFKDFLWALFIVLLCIALFVGAIFGIGHVLVSYECGEYSKMNNIDTRVVAGNCYLKEDGRWYRWDEYKLRNATTGTAK